MSIGSFSPLGFLTHPFSHALVDAVFNLFFIYIFSSTYPSFLLVTMEGCKLVAY